MRYLRKFARGSTTMGMPAELVARLDLDLLYPPFLARLLDMLADCRAAGTEYVATLGFRTWSQQLALYARGRTAPGVRVTDAQPGQSAHNFGLAVDFFAAQPREAGGPLVPNWAPGQYELLGQMAAKHQLLWGGIWTVLPDRPHVQWPRYVHASDLEPLRLAWLKLGFLPTSPADVQNALQRAWALLDPNTTL